MQVGAIVAEYNPFHNGHAHQIAETRRRGATHIAAVMGGHFLQRGDAASFDKWTRARAALCGGVDLVLELPCPYALSSAEFFARGAVELFDALGCVDLLSFGSECGDLSLLLAAARAADESQQGETLQPFLKQGFSYPRARQAAVEARYGADIAAVLTAPNNTLGVEYLRALTRLQSSMRPLTIPRRGAAHDASQARDGFASASLLRRRLAESPEGLRGFVPPAAYSLYREPLAAGHAPGSLRRLEVAVLSKLRCMTPAQLGACADLSEGLENRLYAAARRAGSLQELFEAVKTKRYPLARIRRSVLACFLDIRREDLQAPPPYLRVLGFNARGREILSRARETSRLPLGVSLARLREQSEACARFAELEARATDQYMLSLPQPRPCGLDYTHKPVIITEP